MFDLSCTNSDETKLILVTIRIIRAFRKTISFLIERKVLKQRLLFNRQLPKFLNRFNVQ